MFTKSRSAPRMILSGVLCLGGLAACGGGGTFLPDMAPDGAGATPDLTSGAPDMASPPSPDLAPPPTSVVTFSYTPAWSGVKAVTVIGAFGTPSDWTAPIATLTANAATGTFTGTATVPYGTYPYLFHVVGDSASSAPTTFARDAVDPDNSAYVACPMGSPTYDAKAANPCSQITVPQSGVAPTLYKATGKVTYNGAAAANYLVILERNETGSHHYFVNRVNTAANGSFSLSAAPGQYRLQVLYPTVLSVTDAARKPLTDLALRRAISTDFSLAAAVAVPSVEMYYAGYAKWTPASGATNEVLPTTFTYALPTNAPAAALAIYGVPTGGADIGDPWYTSAAAKTLTASFSGTFTTAAATQTTAVAGQTYYWGIDAAVPAAAAGDVTWGLESMVFPVTFK